ncbi:MAG: hypothetical protein JHC95_12215 [Solirubrobacteraceae bacterium]|nr:hypothetical protein [Solirubrobacteraceae bacterium]
MSDGTQLAAPMTTPHPWPDLSYAETDLATRELTMRLRGGQTLVVELGSAGDDDLPATGRPVVYLDQRHWITLAQRLHNPDAIAERDRKPAERLIELSRSKAVVLPVSSANLWEIAPTGRHRRDVALTMVDLSRGWQLRDPVTVRGHELSRSMAAENPARAEAVITLEPGATFGTDFAPSAGAGLPDDWRAVSERVTNAIAALAAMLEDDSPADVQKRRAVGAAWAAPHHQLAMQMREAGTSREHIRISTLARLVSDLGTELATKAHAAGMGPEPFAVWLRDEFDQAIETMPYVRTLREVLYHRLSNADDHWSGNDLADSQFLCCAAAYADFVAAERKFGNYLQRARNTYGDNAVTVTTLAHLVGELEAAA